MDLDPPFTDLAQTNVTIWYNLISCLHCDPLMLTHKYVIIPFNNHYSYTYIFQPTDSNS